MSRRANPKLVGGFVLTAIALLVTAALVFGSFSFFETTRRFVVFFQGSVDGLAAGSQVLFRGVPLGKVVDVGSRYNPTDSSFQIPVSIEIRPGVIDKYYPPVNPNTELMKEMIDQGLRARLESASLVTGQQVVQLNFFPGTPANFEKTTLPYYQLPTVPSPTQQIMSSVDAAARDLPTLIKQVGVVLDRDARAAPGRSSPSSGAVYSVGSILSGHTLKHLAAAAACFAVLRYFQIRRPIT
jgi:paraquat-inducible protein B